MTRSRTSSILTVTLSLGVASGFLGCAGSPVKDVKVQEISQSSDPNQEMRNLEDQLKAAQQNEINVYAPDYYSKAVESFENAQKDQRSGKDVKSILKNIAEGNAYLSRGQEVALVSKSALGDVVEARNKAVKADAPQYARKDFEEAEKNLYKAVVDIEKGSTTTAQSKQDNLLKQYRKTELNAILEKNLGKSAATIQSARKEGADEWAPRTLKVAENKYIEAKSFILKNPEDKATIETLASQSQEASDQLLRTTLRAKQIESRPPEETAAYIEKENQRLEDYRQKTSEAELTLSEQNKKLEKLESREELDQKIAKIRASFGQNEADVIRGQGGITIRVKGLNFPTAKSTIPSSDFGLLRKVEVAIKELGPSDVKIIGNTDSTGSKSKNKKISKNRADAVKSFIESDTSLPVEKIETVGMADENPIASNKTASGRELNRRVDVVIRPSTRATG